MYVAAVTVSRGGFLLGLNYLRIGATLLESKSREGRGYYSCWGYLFEGAYQVQSRKGTPNILLLLLSGVRAMYSVGYILPYYR